MYHGRPIFTDGAKNEDGVASADVLAPRTISSRFPSSCSVFISKDKAILSALRFTPQLEDSRFLICSDYLGSGST